MAATGSNIITSDGHADRRCDVGWDGGKGAAMVVGLKDGSSVFCVVEMLRPREDRTAFEKEDEDVMIRLGEKVGPTPPFQTTSSMLDLAGSCKEINALDASKTYM